MKTLPALVTSLAAAPAMAAAPAQETRSAPPPGPMEACRPLAGVWKGSGKITPTGDPAQSMGFDATIESSWAAGGEALLEVVRATMEDGETIEFVHLYAYDRAAGTMRVTGVGPEGMLNSSAACRHVGESTLQTIWVGEEPDGSRYSELFNMTLAGDVLSIDIQRSVDGGPAFVFATGSFARQEREAGVVEAAQVRGAGLAEHMTPIAAMVGDYEVTGKFHGLGEMPVFSFSGNEWNQPIAGGRAILSRLEMKSDDGALTYSAVALTGWDPAREAFRRASASNMDGGSVSTMGVAADGGFYSAYATDRDGSPYVETMQITVEEGRLASARIDGMTDGAARRVADMRFTPVRD